MGVHYDPSDQKKRFLSHLCITVLQNFINQFNSTWGYDKIAQGYSWGPSDKLGTFLLADLWLRYYYLLWNDGMIRAKLKSTFEKNCQPTLTGLVLCSSAFWIWIFNKSKSNCSWMLCFFDHLKKLIVFYLVWKKLQTDKCCQSYKNSNCWLRAGDPGG